MNNTGNTKAINLVPSILGETADADKLENIFDEKTVGLIKTVFGNGRQSLVERFKEKVRLKL